MLCQLCHLKDATIHIQQIVNGEVQSCHLCQDCAAKKAAESPELKGFNLAEMLFDIAEKTVDIAAGESSGDGAASESPDRTQVCPICGWDLERFRKTGYLGCPDCYRTFEPVLVGMLKNLHRGDTHRGKIPLTSEADRPIREKALLRRQAESLRKELEQCVAREEYEQAAALRDRIQALNDQLHAEENSPHDA